MSDKLNEEIEKADQEYWKAVDVAEQAVKKAEAAIKARDVAEARVDALRLAAELRPVSVPAGPSRAGSGAGKGRQPGAISRPWRAVLLKLAETHPHGASDDVIAAAARDEGLTNTRPKDARDRMTDYQHHGYVETAPLGWRVTDAAIHKFKDPAPASTFEEIETDAADPGERSAA